MLSRHKRFHTGSRRFQCDHCEYKCFQKSALNKHLLNHSNEKSCCCIVCVHLQEQPYHCSQCAFRCTSKQSLKNHLLIHFGDTPFHCSQCYYSSRKKSNLKRHLLIHLFYAQAFQKLECEEMETPETTTLLQKTIETQLPSKYRLTFKQLTGIIADQIYDLLDQEECMEKVQRGNKKCLGIKNQLLINNTILEDCLKRSRDLRMAWIDYKIAFDSVPHSWIKRCLELYNTDRKQGSETGYRYLRQGKEAHSNM